MQKTHGHGSETRYFWNVSLAGNGSAVYRSRCATSAGVRKQFKSRGYKVKRITATRA